MIATCAICHASAFVPDGMEGCPRGWFRVGKEYSSVVICPRAHETTPGGLPIDLRPCGSKGVIYDGCRTFADIRALVSALRVGNVPPGSDGYHVYLSPLDEVELLADNEFQRLSQSPRDDLHQREAVFAYVVGCTFRRHYYAPIGTPEVSATVLRAQHEARAKARAT